MLAKIKEKMKGGKGKWRSGGKADGPQIMDHRL